MMLLEAAGIQCEGFEARDRVGGRLRTVRTESGFFDAGAEWIDGDHRRLIDLVTELEGPPSAENMWPGDSYVGGVRYREDDFGPEIKAAMARVEEEADRLALDLDETPWMNVLYADLDSQTLGEFLDRNCPDRAARAALEGIYRSDEGDDTDQIGLLGWLCGRVSLMERSGDEMSSMRFPNGAQGFCESMAGRLRGGLHLGTVLRYVRAQGDGVALGFDSGERLFDRVVLALPPYALRYVRFEPGLSEAKQDAIDEAAMSRTIKIALHFRRRFWTTQRVMTDGILQQLWDGSRGETHTLLAYLGGDHAMALAERGAAEAGATLVVELAKLMPEAADEFIRAELFDWTADEWAGGGFFYPKPGYVLGHWEALIRSEGPVYFAGEHSTMWTGYIEGALESAERVSQEIIHAKDIHKL